MLELGDEGPLFVSLLLYTFVFFHNKVTKRSLVNISNTKQFLVTVVISAARILRCQRSQRAALARVLRAGFLEEVAFLFS